MTSPLEPEGDKKMESSALHKHNRSLSIPTPLPRYRPRWTLTATSYPEDHPAPLAIRASAQPTNSQPKQKGNRIRSLKDEDITEEETDLSMYRLSDDDSDSSLTIYYKAYNKTKPEINESNAESAQTSHDMEQEIKRLEAE
jgi:hypothetical protein